MKPEIRVNVEVDDKDKEKKIDPWEISNGIETLGRAQDVLANKPLMKEIQKKLDGLNKIRSIGDLRVAQQKVAKEANEVEDRDDNDTPDDKATAESNEKRVKNSSNPTTVGKVMR